MTKKHKDAAPAPTETEGFGNFGDFGMGDLLIEGQEPVGESKPAEVQGLLLPVEEGEPNNNVKVNFEPDRTPKDIYYTAGDAEFERMLPYLIGQASTAKIKTLALGRGVRPVGVLRQGIWLADEHGAFDPTKADTRDPKQRRTGNDDRMDHPDNVRMRAVLSEPMFQIVLKQGREHRISNQAALYFGVANALDVGMI